MSNRLKVLALLFVVGMAGVGQAEAKKEPAKAKQKQEPAKQEQKQEPAKAAEKSRAEQLQGDVITLRQQELVVQVLQYQHQKESQALGQMQQQFCDRYQLDAEKFRKGLYRYDEKADTFVEQQPDEAPAKTDKP